MKKRPLFIAVYICLLLCFIIGAAELLSFLPERVSESENRMLQGIPELSGDSLICGQFMDELEAYLSDAFFFRDEAAGFSENAMGVFALDDASPDSGEVDEARLFAPVTQTEPEPEESPDISEGEIPPDSQAVPVQRQVDPSQLSDVEFYLTGADGKRTVTKSYPAADVAVFADILNSYREALPADGTLNFTVPPVSSVFQLISPSGAYTGWGSNLEDVLQPVVADGVYIYDVTDILTPYIGSERLYPLSDHHWQPFSASKVAEAMLSRQGVVPMDYYEYRYYLDTRPSSKALTYGELSGMRLSADSVHLMEPVSPVEAFMLSHMTDTKPDVFIDRAYTGLMYYLGGLKTGPWRLFDSGFHTGRNALVIGDSFELTFTPFIMPYYDTVLVTDLRDTLYSEYASGGSIREYIGQYDISDIYMLYSTYSPFCGEMVTGPLTRYLG